MPKRKAAQDQIPQPPDPPSVERHLHFHPVQAIGVPLILLIPVLALFGVFGEGITSARASQGPIEASIEYPSKMRYKTIDVVDLVITNTSQQTVAGTTVTVDRAYLDGFTSVSFTPDVKTITGEEYVVEVGEIPAGESRVVSIDIQAERYGGYDGDLSIATDGAPLLVFELSTFNYP